MAKCKHFASEAKGTNSKGMACMFECPKSADTDCNIRKPRPKLKRIKAWADIFGERSQWIDISQFKGDKFLIPCTILRDEKYLKGKDKK